MIQVVSVLGAVTILAAVLSAVAFVEDQWGFLLRDGTWTLINLFTLARIVAGSPPAPAA